MAGNEDFGAEEPEPLEPLQATPDGERHVGCGQPWIWCFCYPRRRF